MVQVVEEPAYRLEAEPGRFEGRDSLGWVSFQRGDYPKAVELLERAVALAADDPTISEHLGDAYNRSGRTADALRIYARRHFSVDLGEAVHRTLRNQPRVLAAVRRTLGRSAVRPS